MQHWELRDGLLIRGVLLTETSKHHFAAVQAGSYPASCWCPHVFENWTYYQYLRVHRVGGGIHQRARTSKKTTGLRDKSNQDTRSSCCVKHNARRSPAFVPSRRFAARFSPEARSKVPSSYTSACMHLLHHWLALRRHFKATNPISAASYTETANRKHHHTARCAARVIPGRQHASGSVTSPSLACFRQTQPRSSRHD